MILPKANYAEDVASEPKKTNVEDLRNGVKNNRK